MKLEMNIRNIDEKIIAFLIIGTPFIDLLNGVAEYILKINISPGVILRSIILIVLLVVFIAQKKHNIIKVIFILCIFIFQIMIISSKDTVNLYSEISFISKIYYNMFLIFIIYRLTIEKKINYDFYINKLVQVNLIVTISLIITKALGISINSYGEAGGYKGLYMGLNDLTAVLTLTFPFILYKLANSNQKFKYSIFATIAALNIVMLGTKTSIVVMAIFAVFFTYQVIFKEKKVTNIIIVIFIISIFFIVFERYFWDLYSSTILVRLKYFIEKNNFITFLVSGRNLTLNMAMKYWVSNINNVLFGLGFTKGAEYISSFLVGHGMIEMDFFDILYFYGIFIFLIIAIPVIRALLKAIKLIVKSKKLLYKLIALVYIIGFVISFLGGHVILSPLAGIYFAVILGMVHGVILEEGNS